MAYTANDYQKIIEDYVNSPQGRKFLKERQGLDIGYTSEQMRIIGENLQRDIIQAFLALVKDPYASAAFDSNSIEVHVNPSTTRDTARVTVLFRPDVLRRPSLYKYEDPIDESAKFGVYDIIGLFTQGYYAFSYAYGVWGRYVNGTMVEEDNSCIRSRAELAPNSFVNQVIHRYQRRYPDVIFEWPKEWGGNK